MSKPLGVIPYIVFKILLVIVALFLAFAFLVNALLRLVLPKGLIDKRRPVKQNAWLGFKWLVNEFDD